MLLHRRIEKGLFIDEEEVETCFNEWMLTLSQSLLSLFPQITGRSKQKKVFLDLRKFCEIKNENIYRKKREVFQMTLVVMICGDCYGDIAAYVKLRNFDGLFLFEGCRWFLVDFSDYVDDFSWLFWEILKLIKAFDAIQSFKLT